jgi:choline dehydrogenase-like flavoprotein
LVTIGNPGWGFEDLVPYFKKAQSHSAQENDILPGTGTVKEYEGIGGPIKVRLFCPLLYGSYVTSQTSYNTWYSSLIIPFVKSITELSFKINSNPHGGDTTGVFNGQRTVDNSTSTRQDSGVTYLGQTTGRGNISVLVGAQATKLLFAEVGGDLIVTAVEFVVDGVKHIVKATKEVVLSAGRFSNINSMLLLFEYFTGTYKTPQLLELSGIGKNSILSKYGIQTRVDLPVGENCQDHLMVSLNFGLTSEAQGEV